MKSNLLRGLLWLMAYLPWPVLGWVGRMAGRLLYLMKVRLVNDARVNLQIAFPQMSPEERKRLLRDTLCQSAVTFCEMPRIWQRDEDHTHRVDDNGLPQTMTRLAGQGRGLILAMPHHGNWEIVSSGIAKGLRITGLYRPPRLAFLEPIMTRGRSIARINMVPTDRSGIKALHKALRDGEVIAILPDQVPKMAGAAGVPAPFFGRESVTMTLLGRFAARQDTPVLFVWAERQDDGRYRLEYFEGEPAVRDRDPVVAATALNRAVERCILSEPSQYQWAYRRYGPLAPGERSPYGR